MGVSGGRGGGVVGSAVPQGPGRVLAAAAHGNLAGPLLISLVGLMGGAGDGALGFGLFLAFLWTVGDGVAWFLARRMSSPAASHAAQAFWVAVVALPVFVVLVALSGGTALGFVALVVLAVPGALGAYRVLRGAGHRYPGVATLMEGRR